MHKSCGRWLVWAGAVFLWCGAQPADGFAASPDSSRVATVTTALTPNPARPGDPFHLSVVLEIQPGWMINSNAPGEGRLLPTEIHVEMDPAVTLEPFQYPVGQPQRLPGSDRPVAVWTGTVAVTAEGRLDDEAGDETAALTGSVSLQACNAEMCLPPATIAFSVPVRS